jgi:hypothetical protein
MFTAYIDDSGSDPNQAVANATALIIPGARIVALEREWDALKRKEGFSCWHTSEFVAGKKNPKSEFAKWDDEKHDRVFRRVRNICKKYGVQPMSFSVKKQDYDEVVPEFFRKHSGKFHYTWAIRHILAHTVQWRLSRSIKHPLEYVFDWMGEKRKNLRRREIEDVMDQAEEDAASKGRIGEYANWSFRCRTDIPGLQCVDALAWCVYQYGTMVFCKKPLITDAKIAWDDFSTYLGGKWQFDVTVTRENLKKWVEQELADGASMEKFKAWEERKLAGKNKHAKARTRKVRRGSS